MSEPPRRYDVEDDRGLPYERRVGHLLDVFLDGQRLTKVIRFDCDKGEVERFQTNADGHIIYDRAKGDVEREVLRGIVETKWREGVVV